MPRAPSAPPPLPRPAQHSRLSSTRGAATALTSGLLNLAHQDRWLYSTPVSYCALRGNVAQLVAELEQRVFYLGPVTRNKVVRAVQLARGVLQGVSEADAVLEQNVTVALIVADLQMDCDTVCAAVLRGLIGGVNGCAEDEVEREVGGGVLRILEFHRSVERSVALCIGEGFTEMSFVNLRELILVGAMEEHRAISLELARAVLEIRMVGGEADGVRRGVARRAMYLYAPLANQMGMWFVQGELEELAFMYLKPDSFDAVRKVVGERRRECESTLVRSKEFVERMLSSSVEVRKSVRTVLIKGRVKGLYSVYRKMRRSGKKVHEIYDLLALRVVVLPMRADEQGEIAACYAVADAIKRHFDTFESRAKDYIAAPKRNGYRSVHLTVVPRGGSTPLEIQIRTEKMHHVAEYGAAAHWIYKETDGTGVDDDMRQDDAGHGQGARPDGPADATSGEEQAHKRWTRGGADDAASDEAAGGGGEAAVEMTYGGYGCAGRKGRERAPRELGTLAGGMQRRGGRSENEVQDQVRKGYVTCLASAIRASRVIVAAAGQLYGLAVGSTLLDLARGLGVASWGAIAVVNGSVAPLTQRLEMNDIVRFISEAG